MKRILLILLSTSYLYSQVIDSYTDCHQGYISVTLVGPPNTTYHLESHDMGWSYIAGSNQLSYSDTSEIMFSGIGYEMHEFDSIRVMKVDSVILSLSMPCIGVGIEDNANFGVIIKVEYYNLMGQIIKESNGVCFEVITYSNYRQSVRKLAISGPPY